MLNKISYTSLFLIASSQLAFAISTTTPSKLSDGIALERIQAYSQSSTKSKTVGIVEPGTQLIEHKNFLKTKPGIAVMEEMPKTKSIPFDRGANVYIWEYLEQGFSKITINNIPYTAKIARSKTECDIFPPSPKYCWAKVIEQPEYYEWKQVSLKPDSQRFWILNRIIDGSGIISIKDAAISKARLIHTTTKEVPAEPEAKEEVKETVEIKQDDSLLFKEQIEQEMDLPEDPLEREFILNALKSKEQRAKEKAEELKAQKKINANRDEFESKELSPEDIFKQDSLTDSNPLSANMNNSNVTINTLKQVNKEFNKPAMKLELKANQPLTLPFE